MSRPYESIHSESYKIGRFVVVLDTLLIEGRKYPFSYIEQPESVCVTAICGDRLVLLRQYRHAVDVWNLEFPCGAVDEGETPVAAARREVFEETGYIADRIIPLGSQFIQPGISNGRVFMFLAYCTEKRPATPEPAEFIDVTTVPVNEFEIMIKNGVFEQMLGLICWFKAREYLKAEEIKC